LQGVRGGGVRTVGVGVPRYCGGTKLGEGGLARACRAGAGRALRDAPTLAAVPTGRVLVGVPLSLDGETRHLVARHGGRVESFSCEDPARCVLFVTMRLEARARLRADPQALTRGAARIVDLDDPI